MKDYTALVKSIESGKYAPIYLLHGEEPYYIDKLVSLFENKVLDESEKAFNFTTIYGKDCNADHLIESCRRLPMMSNHQLIILREAQQFKDFDKLEGYFKQPTQSTIFVIAHKYKKADARKAFVKLIQKNGEIFHAQKLYDNQIPQWITDLVNDKGLQISARNVALIADFLGNDLGKIENEVSKVIIGLNPGDSITADMIEKNIGISKDFNIFELQSAIAMRRVDRAHQIVNYFAKNPKMHPFSLTISNLYNYLTKVLKLHFLQGKSQTEIAGILKVNPYFIKEYQLAKNNYTSKQLIRAIRQLRIFDEKFKGIGNATTNEENLLRELVVKIMY